MANYLAGTTDGLAGELGLEVKIPRCKVASAMN